MAKIQAVWALDIGQAALKALKLVPGETPGLVTAEAFDYVEYPKILSQPDADPEQLVREALETFLERNEIKGCKVAIAVPGQAGLVKFIKLPPVEKKRIPDIVKFEARQQIPFALDEVVWAYQQIGDEDEDSDEDFTMAEVGLFAMKRDQINRAILPFRVAGIEVDIVQMGPIALYNFITFDQIKEGPPPPAPAAPAEGEAPAAEPAEAKPAPKKIQGSVVLLDIGADNTDLIITDGTRIWQRNVPIGGNHFTRALTKELKLTFAKAEHLKRNATKAPDPRSIFTAMRGVFNDFASEINRSIGFYSSVNRSAQIAKIVGLGNGFKLPGLQKFLQQNLSHEVEKLDAFQRMVGEDVKTAPQFQENLASFAVVYGLAVQGLNRSGLRTNLLPPEIEQVRLIRAKKPWALAASALLMLGFSGLFLGDYRVLAKVDTEEFKGAVSQAKGATDKGSRFKSEYDAAKGEWQGVYSTGASLLTGSSDRARWPNFLKVISQHFPDPADEYHLDSNNPKDQPTLDKLRVHIDGIKPVWRANVDSDWYSSSGVLSPLAKDLMHPLDRTAPTGEGWIIQIIGHHYNPYPSVNELRKPLDQRLEFGPYEFLVRKVLRKLMTPDLRLFGVHHVALAWMLPDTKWTTLKGSRTNNLTSNAVPILDRAAAAEGGSTGSGAAATSAPATSAGRSNAAYQLNQGTSGMQAPAVGMPGMSGMGMPPSVSAEEAKNMVTLTRTDFLIQFIWQPPKPEDAPKTPEEQQKKLEEVTKQLTDAEALKQNTMLAISKQAESELSKASLKQSEALSKTLSQGAAASPAGVPGLPAIGGPAPGMPPGAPASGAPAGATTPPK